MTTATDVEVKETGMIFTGESVRAILEGRKTITRRVIKPQPHKNVARFVRSLARAGWLEEYDNGDPLGVFTGGKPVTWTQTGKPYRCPYGDAGDRLWVRESWKPLASQSKPTTQPLAVMAGSAPTYEVRRGACYQADGTIMWSPHTTTIQDLGRDAPTEAVSHLPVKEEWHNSMFMPRWASRITLEIKSIRVERLQEITGRDVLAEGVDNGASNPAMGQRWENMQRMAFEDGWNSINGKRKGCAWSDNPWLWVIEFKKL